MEPEEYQRIAEAEERHWWYRATRTLAQQFLRPRLESGSHLLDAGCGPGGNSSWWLDHGDVTGVDISSDAIALARERHPRMNAIRGDMTHLPLEDGTFDAVQILTVLYTVDDDRLALREVARVLKPGGAAFILEPANPRLRRDHDAVTHARRRYRLPGLVERTEEAGLGILRASHAYSFLLPPALALALAHRFAADDPGGERSDLQRDRMGALLAYLARAERRIIARHDIPAGLSALVLAVKPG